MLNVKVGESLRAGERGERMRPYLGVSFQQIGNLLAAFTPKRWDLIAALRKAGLLTVVELARHLGRNYKNVHADVAQLVEWMAVERAEDGRVSVPWSEIVVDTKSPERVAA